MDGLILGSKNLGGIDSYERIGGSVVLGFVLRCECVIWIGIVPLKQCIMFERCEAEGIGMWGFCFLGRGI